MNNVFHSIINIVAAVIILCWAIDYLRRFFKKNKKSDHSPTKNRISAHVPVALYYRLVDATTRNKCTITNYIIDAITERLQREMVKDAQMKMEGIGNE